MPERAALPPGVDLTALTRLRHALHRAPERSGEEADTRDRLTAFLTETAPDGLISGIGSHGVAAVFDGAAPGPWVMLRADMDAVAVAEVAAHDHASRRAGLSHACGHDGHMAILCGMAQALGARRPACGKAILLFQPAEESGEGAAAVTADPRFGALRPHYAFAIHNLPGFPFGAAVCRPGAFAAASTGLRLRFRGRTAHAADADSGISPAGAVAAVIQGLAALPGDAARAGTAAWVTVVHARLGQPAFGVAPGEGEVWATLRAYDDAVMATLRAGAETLARRAAAGDGLNVSVSTHESFPAAVNDPDTVARLKKTLGAAGCDWVTPGAPMRFSEDMAHLLKHCPGALIGLGAGAHCPGLHQSDYDFPDALIGAGIGIFAAILEDWLGARSAATEEGPTP